MGGAWRAGWKVKGLRSAEWPVQHGHRFVRERVETEGRNVTATVNSARWALDQPGGRCTHPADADHSAVRLKGIQSNCAWPWALKTKLIAKPFREAANAPPRTHHLEFVLQMKARSSQLPGCPPPLAKFPFCPLKQCSDRHLHFIDENTKA